MILKKNLIFNFRFFKKSFCAIFLLSFCEISHSSLVLNYTEKPAQMRMDAWWWNKIYFFTKYWSAAFKRTFSHVFWTNTCWAWAIWSYLKKLYFFQKLSKIMKNSNFSSNSAVFHGFGQFLEKIQLFMVTSNCPCSASIGPKNMRESAFESCGSIFFEKINFMSSSRLHPHLCWFFCVIEDEWRMRNFAKTKQKNCAKWFFEKSKIEGDDDLKNHLYCGWKYFETILLSRTKPYVHIFRGCWENRNFVFRRLLNATLYVVWWKK